MLFLAAGAVQWMRRPVVRLDAQDLNQLASYWKVQMQRPPNKAELAGIISDRIDEELLAREALRLGLDKGDSLFVSETPEGFAASPYDPAFAAQMEAARNLMKSRRNALHELGKPEPEAG